MRAAQLLERNYTANNTYVTDLAPLHGLAAGAAVFSGENPTAGNYRITAAGQPCVEGIVLCFTLTATRNGITDPACGDLTLTSTGVRGIVDGTDTADRCWLR
jgi:Tfp pilus assembly protein PilE